MSQKLTRTINLPRPPASFDPEVRRFFDDYSRAITAQFQDAFDLFGEGDSSLEVHVGNTGLTEGTDPPHGATESPNNGTIAKRTSEGKLRFVGADGSEDSEDYGVNYGSVKQIFQHIGQTESVHGSTSIPTEGHLAVFGAGGSLSANSPSSWADQNVVNKKYLDDTVVDLLTKVDQSVTYDSSIDRVTVNRGGNNAKVAEADIAGIASSIKSTDGGKYCLHIGTFQIPSETAQITVPFGLTINDCTFILFPIGQENIVNILSTNSTSMLVQSSYVGTYHYMLIGGLS